MKITEISYRSLRTGHGYNNSSVEARAIVEEGEQPENALAELRFWVDKQVDDTLKREDAYEALDRIKESVAYQTEETKRLQKRIEAQREVIRDHEKLATLARESGLGGAALLLSTAS